MKVLLPVDGSETSNQMLQWVSQTMDRSKVECYLLSVISDAMIAEYRLEDAHDILEKSRKYLESQGLLVADAKFLTGDPTELICRYAEENGMDQIVAGSHGRSGIAKMLLGSVSEGLLKRCKCPVTIFRHDREHQMTADVL